MFTIATLLKTKLNKSRKENNTMKNLKCFTCWYKSTPDAPKEYVYVFAYTAKQAMFFFLRSTGIMFEYCEEAELYKEEKDFTIFHEAGEVWGCNAMI